MNILLLIMFGISLLYESCSQAVVIGSNSAVSIITTSTLFPSVDTDNTMLGFACFKGGFTLEDATTSCTFDSLYPVSGVVNMNGGTLYLLQDMILANQTQLIGLGTIIGNGHSIEFCESVTAMPSNLKVIQDLNLFFDGDVVLTGSITVKGNCLINPTGNMILIGEDVNVIIDENSTLYIQDTRLENVHNNICCLADTSHLILQDVLVCLMGDSHFLYGDITYRNIVKIIGASTFWYDSANPCLIDDEATLIIDGGMTLKTGRKTVDGQDSIQFYDEESILSCGECNFVVTANGLNLKRGRIEIIKNIMIATESTDTTHGIVLGDGISEDEDMTIYLGPGSQTVSACVLKYNNVQPDRFYSSGPSACFIRMFNSYFYVAKNCIYPSTDVLFEIVDNQYSPTVLAEGVTLYYNNMHARIPGFNDVTYYACRTSDYSCFLNGNDFIYISSGLLMDNLWVSGLGNMISGNGDAAGEIILHDNNSQLLLSLSGSILNTISLNGGSIKLYNDVCITTPNCFISSGTIDIDKYILEFNYTEGTAVTHTFDCPIDLHGKNGFIDMFDNTTLATTWTISGQVTIDGNSNMLSIVDGGRLVVANGASLTIKNMRLNLIGSGDITCIDDSGIITLDDVHWVQNENFAFTKGFLNFKNSVKMSGQGLVFSYQSTQTSTIDYDSVLELDYRFTYKYAPSNDSQALMEFKDFSSQLCFRTSTFYVVPGLRLSKGQLLVQEDATIYALGDGLTLGDQTGGNDMQLLLLNHHILTIAQGTLNYKNVETGSLQMNFDSSLYLYDGVILNVYEDIVTGNSGIQFGINSQYVHISGKKIIGSFSGWYIEKYL